MPGLSPSTETSIGQATWAFRRVRIVFEMTAKARKPLSAARMDIPQLVDQVERALGGSADVVLVERIAKIILSEQSAKRTTDSTYSAGDMVARLSLTTGEHETLGAQALAQSDMFSSVTLFVSLANCTSDLPATLRARIYDQIRRSSSRLVDVTDRIFASQVKPVPTRVLAVTPISLIGKVGSYREALELAAILDQATIDVGASAICGYTIFVKERLDPTSSHLLEALPSVLSKTRRVRASISISKYAAAATYRIAELIFQIVQSSDQAPKDSLSKLEIVLDDSAGTSAHNLQDSSHEVEAFVRLELADDYRSVYSPIPTLLTLGTERQIALALATSTGLNVEGHLDHLASTMEFKDSQPRICLDWNRVIEPHGGQNFSVESVARELLIFCGSA